MKDPLLRYRVMANLVGAVLVVLVFVAVPLNHVFGHPGLSRVVAVVHGYAYLVLVISVLLLGRAHRWPVTRVVLVALAGTVPVLSFVVERRVSAREMAVRAERARAAASPEPAARP